MKENEIGMRVQGKRLLQINYLASDETILASHKTQDAYTPAEIREWEEWLQDSGVSHPGAPEKWSSFELVPYLEPA